MFLNVPPLYNIMEVSFADKLGTEDRHILGVSIVDGELELHLDKPKSLGWQELIYFIKYVIAQALSEENELSASDIFQWLGAQGVISDEVETQAADILTDARHHRLLEMAKKEKLRLDKI